RGAREGVAGAAWGAGAGWQVAGPAWFGPEPIRAFDVQFYHFQPGAVVAPAGTTVTWTNRDDIEHTVTSGDPEHRIGRFDLRLPGRGASTTVRFSEPGVYPYFCDRHPSMRGEIRVEP